MGMSIYLTSFDIDTFKMMNCASTFDFYTFQRGMGDKEVFCFPYNRTISFFFNNIHDPRIICGLN